MLSHIPWANQQIASCFILNSTNSFFYTQCCYEYWALFFSLCVHKPCSWLQHSLYMDVSAAFSGPTFIKGNLPSLLQKPHVLFSWRVSLQWSLKVYGGEKERGLLQISTWGWCSSSWLHPHLIRHWEGIARLWMFWLGERLAKGNYLV